jgi:hypothetical protein
VFDPINAHNGIKSFLWKWERGVHVTLSELSVRHLNNGLDIGSTYLVTTPQNALGECALPARQVKNQAGLEPFLE